MIKMKCQFYIILGDKDFKGKNDNNVYINVTDETNVAKIKNDITYIWQEKKKENPNIEFSDQIIFMIPSPEYDLKCNKLMKELVRDGRGKIEYIPKKEEIQRPINVEDKKNNTSIDSTNSKDNDKINYSTERKEEILEKNNTESTNNFKYSYKPDTVYHGDIESPKSTKNNNIKMENKDAITYMGYNPNLINSNVKSLVKRPNKNNAFISLPVIIFILSAMLLVASTIILFALD